MGPSVPVMLQVRDLAVAHVGVLKSQSAIVGSSEGALHVHQRLIGVVSAREADVQHLGESNGELLGP